MNELGSVLDLLEGASRRVGSAVGSVRKVYDRQGMREAIWRIRPDLRQGASERASPRPVGEHVQIEDFWVQWPLRMRVDRRTSTDVPETRIVDEGEWWSYDPEEGAEASLGNARAFLSIGGVPHLLDPSHLIPALELEAAGEAEAAGRGAVRVRGRLRDTIRQLNQPDPYLLARGAEAYELLVDQERGIVLRASSFLAGTPIQVVELTSLEFDTAIPEGTFRLQLPEGVEFRPGLSSCERMAARQADRCTRAAAQPTPP